MEGAFTLSCVVAMFPPGTVHLAVVDPDVGTSRKGVALRIGSQLFVGPDNGLFSLLARGTEVVSVVQLDSPEVWRTPTPSTTFHGRDIFAPVAARLASGLELSRAGSVLDSMHSMHWPQPISDEQGISGWVVHMDRFGNCITNISRSLFDEHAVGRSFKCYVGNAIISRCRQSYGQVSAGDDLVLFNSADLLEIAVHRGSARELLNIRKGAPVNVVFSDEKG